MPDDTKRRRWSRYPIRPLEERFHEKYVVDARTGCWVWQANQQARGYGLFWFRGASTFAHRASYTMFVGPIPEGLTVDHLCRNPRCVNPDHLEAVTQRENILRAPQALAAINSRKTHCIRGHPFTAANTRIDKSGFRVCRACQRDHTRAHRLRLKEAGPLPQSNPAHPQS